VERGKATQYDMTGAACSVVGVAAAWRLGLLCAENVSGSTCRHWCEAAEGSETDLEEQLDNMMQMQPKGRRVSDRNHRIAQRMREVTEQLQVQMKQLLLQRWKGEVVRAVQQGLGAGRVDVRQLVVGVVDAVVGKEVNGVVLPRPKLRAEAQEWTSADQETEVVEMATEEPKATTIEEETTAAAVDEAPKAPADGVCAATLFARVLASSRQKEQQQEKQDRTKDAIARVLASKRKQERTKDLITRVLASSKLKQQGQAGWVGGGGHIMRCILEGMTL